MKELTSQTKENLIQRLDRHLDWIKSCDTKASIVIAGAGIFLNIFTAEHSISMLNQIISKAVNNISAGNLFYLLSFLVFWGVFLYGAYCLIRVLVPMMKKDVIAFQQGTYENSLYYFETADDKKYSEFREMMLKETEENEIEDLLSQIYMNSKICSSKYRFYKKGIRLSFVGIAGILILYIYGIVLLKLGGL